MQPRAGFSEELDREIDRLIAQAIEEDFDGAGDVTTKSVIGEGVLMRAEIIAKSPGVIAGLAVAASAFAYLDPTVEFARLVEDGAFVEADTRIALVSGSALALLGGERTALNFLQHLSGVATEAFKYAREVERYGVQVLDTRKTTPGLRYLEKYAARVGGAVNHRIGLFDQVLIKDNHIEAAGGIVEAVRRAREAYPDLKVEVEAETFDQVEDALAAGADIILLDNMSLQQLREAVGMVGGKALTEASGGITLATVADVAATGVDRISVGAITQAARPLDISMEAL